MSEELKIIIKAVTSEAKGEIQKVKKELGGIDSQGKKTSKSFGGSMAAMGKACMAVAGAVAAVVVAFVAVGKALTSLEEKTRDYRNEQAKLVSSFQAMGISGAQAKETYSGIFRYLGESDTAAEAAAHLAKLTGSQKDLAQWTKITQGVYATFGDSLAIESLTEAANETARVGKVTGTLADALNWAGVSEDAMNQKLAQANSLQEREKILRETLLGLYSQSAELFERNNQDIIAQNEAQNRLNETTAALGKTVMPLTTALANLSNSFLQLLAPAINAVVPIMTNFVNKISQAVNWVLNFFGLLSGKTDTAETMSQIANGASQAASGASQLTSNLGGATAAAEKLKRATMGFDELNKVSSPSSGGSSGGESSTPSYTGGGGGVAIDTSGLDSALGQSSSKLDGFIAKVKEAFSSIGSYFTNAFAPAVPAWTGALETVKTSLLNALPDFQTGFESIQTAASTLGLYLVEDFAPSIFNSFSTNVLPVLGDVLGFGIEQAGKQFETFAGIIEDCSVNIIQPALDVVKTIATDVFASIKNAWDTHGQPLMDNLDKFFTGIRDTVEELYYEVIEPIVSAVIDSVKNIWNNTLKPLWDKISNAVLNIMNNLLTLWNEVLKPIIDWVLDNIYPVIKKVVKNVLKKVEEIFEVVGGVIGGIWDILDGIIEFITGVFTKDWKKAWNGIKKIFKGVFDALYNVVKIPLNTIIGAINTLLKAITSAVNLAIRALNKISIDIPKWVPGLGGKKFGFDIKELTAPQIPELATGGIVVSETLARIGEEGKKEAVLPLEQNTGWMDMLADRIASRNNTPSKIVLTLDGRELGRASINSINDITRQTGRLQLNLV